MDVEVVEALDDDRTVVRRLLQLYHYDFSEFDGSDVNPHGETCTGTSTSTGLTQTARRSCSGWTAHWLASPWSLPENRMTSPNFS